MAVAFGHLPESGFEVIAVVVEAVVSVYGFFGDRFVFAPNSFNVLAGELVLIDDAD